MYSVQKQVISESSVKGHIELGGESGGEGIHVYV